MDLNKNNNRTRIILIAVIGIIAVVAIVVFFIIKNTTEEPAQQPAPEIVKKEIPKTTQFDWVEYHSEEYGYTISYPDWWIFDTAKKDFGDMIGDHAGNVMIAIQKINTPILKEDKGIIIARGVAKESFIFNDSYVLEDFQSMEWEGHQGYYAKGIYNENGVKWHFQEYGIFVDDHRFVMRAHINNNDSEDYLKTVNKILKSFRLGNAASYQ